MARQNNNLRPLIPMTTPKPQAQYAMRTADGKFLIQVFLPGDNMPPQQPLGQDVANALSGMPYGAYHVPGAYVLAMPNTNGRPPMHVQPAGPNPLQTALQPTGAHLDPASSTVARALDMVSHPDPRECFQLTLDGDDYHKITLGQQEKWVEELYDALPVAATAASQYPALNSAEQVAYYDRAMTNALQKIQALLANPFKDRKAKAYCRLAIDQVSTVHSLGIPQKTEEDKINKNLTFSQRARKLIDITKANKRIALDVANGTNLAWMAQGPATYLEKKLDYSKSNENRAQKAADRRAVEAEDGDSSSYDGKEGESTPGKSGTKKVVQRAVKATTKKASTTQGKKRKGATAENEAQSIDRSAEKKQRGPGANHSVSNGWTPAGGRGTMQASGNHGMQAPVMQAYGPAPGPPCSNTYHMTDNSHPMMGAGTRVTEAYAYGDRMPGAGAQKQASKKATRDDIQAAGEDAGGAAPVIKTVSKRSTAKAEKRKNDDADGNGDFARQPAKKQRGEELSYNSFYGMPTPAATTGGHTTPAFDGMTPQSFDNQKTLTPDSFSDIPDGSLISGADYTAPLSATSSFEPHDFNEQLSQEDFAANRSLMGIDGVNSEPRETYPNLFPTETDAGRAAATPINFFAHSRATGMMQGHSVSSQGSLRPPRSAGDSDFHAASGGMAGAATPYEYQTSPSAASYYDASGTHAYHSEMVPPKSFVPLTDPNAAVDASGQGPTSIIPTPSSVTSPGTYTSSMTGNSAGSSNLSTSDEYGDMFNFGSASLDADDKVGNAFFGSGGILVQDPFAKERETSSYLTGVWNDLGGRSSSGYGPN